MNEVTRILGEIEAGDPAATRKLFPLVYEELRRLAGQRLLNERPGQTLQATALVHEAFMRLVAVAQPQQWESRGHFFSAAAEAMRRILLDHAKARGRVKRGGDRRREALSVSDVAESWNLQETADLDDALRRLEDQDPAMAEVVRLRFFAGLTIEHTAEALGLSPTTVKRRWEYGRTWLYRAMTRGNDKQ